jgi:nucleoside-diphosphate-sugar epimerase
VAFQKRGIEIAVGDLRDPDAVKRFVAGGDGALLIHIAGVIHPPGRTRLFEEVNHQLTLALFDAARNAGVQRFVAISSNSPVGANTTPTEVFTEDSPYNPYMGYGRSKWRMESSLLAAHRIGAPPEVVIVRAPWFYGPGQPPRQSLFFTMVKDGKFPIVGTGENRRSMVFTDNLAQAVLLAAASPAAAGEVFWIADQRPYPMVDIINTVATVLREDFGMTVSNRQIHLPDFVADAARLADTMLQAVGLYHQKIHVLSEMNLTIACSIDKARRILGYAPVIQLREGMRRSIAWCLENGIKI